MPEASFTFSDTIAGYVTDVDREKGTFGLKTSDGREFRLCLGANVYGELVRNLGEPYVDCTGQLRQMLEPGRYLFAYGVFYPEPGAAFEAKHLVLVGRSEREWHFEKPDWWVKQVAALADFYLKAQFGDGDIDFRDYRTSLALGGEKSTDFRQETDTISRLVYGFASAYLLTGTDRYLEAAEKGTRYLREHLRATDVGEDLCYWYHAIDVKGSRERKVLASEFGDDFDAIPAYEQIYALAGPVQTYRVNGDPAVLEDARRTINLFQRHFRDHDKGGYFSHIDPITFDPRAESLGHNQARKNWNSVGDHAPAYLINLLLATGSPEHQEMLIDCADSIVQHFPDYDESPFVQEKFHEDWSKDQTWGWQQNRAVVGHNLKIAWNLMRVFHLKPEERYVQLARRIGGLMPKVGGDPQRGGWYDVVERVLPKGAKVHRFAWHDRKAWWQQEQGILAYLILHGSLKDPEYLRQARESAAFYNAWFLDHDSGGVYFNVLANGLPYLLGTERHKGSHSMSGYHSFELCYLAAVYGNLLVTKNPLDLYFKPLPGALAGNVLRVAPDLLPAGSVRIEEVTINGVGHTDFDAAALTVKLPPSAERLKVRVRLVPSGVLDHFTVRVERDGDLAKLVLAGELDARALPHLRKALLGLQPARRLVVMMDGLKYLSPEGARALIFAREKLDIDEDVFVVGAAGQPREVLDRDEFSEEVQVAASLEAARQARA